MPIDPLAEENSTLFDIDNKNQVVITVEDVKECLNFFDFFEIPVPGPLQKASDAFCAELTLANQHEFRFQMADIIVNNQHPVFKDEVFDLIRPETAEINEALNFERQLEAQLTGTTDDK